MSALAIAVGVVVLLIVILAAYRRWRLGPGVVCGDYPPGPLRDTCQEWAKACGRLQGRDGKACRAAGKQCMPLARAAYDYTRTVKGGLGGSEDWASLFNRMAPFIPDCVDSMTKISPAGGAQLLSQMQVEIPPAAAPFFQDPETRGNVEMVAALTPSAADWGLETGNVLLTPVANTSPTDHFTANTADHFTANTADHFTANTAGGFSVACDPLCPKPECYADMECGPQGSCQAYFANDPTYGGRCVPS